MAPSGPVDWSGTQWHLFNSHFPTQPGLAGTRMSPFWILLELRMMEVVSGDNWSSIRRAKLQSNRHCQQTNTRFLQAGGPSCLSTNQWQSIEEKIITFHRVAHPKFTWESSNLVFNLSTLGEDCRASCPHSDGITPLGGIQVMKKCIQSHHCWFGYCQSFFSIYYESDIQQTLKGKR